MIVTAGGSVTQCIRPEALGRAELSDPRNRYLLCDIYELNHSFIWTRYVGKVAVCPTNVLLKTCTHSAVQ